MRTIIIIVAVFSIGLIAGWAGPKIITADRFAVFAEDGSPRISIGTDEMGNGMIAVYDNAGNALLLVEHGQIITPAQAPIEAPPKSIAQATSPVIFVTRVEQLRPDDKYIEQLTELNEQIASLEEEAAAKEADAALAARKRDTKLRDTLMRQARDLRRDAQTKRVNAAQLERSINEPRHMIRGWTGTVYVTLISTRDITPLLAEIDRTRFITWTGRLASIDDDGKVYEITRIGSAIRPRGFTMPD